MCSGEETAGVCLAATLNEEAAGESGQLLPYTTEQPIPWFCLGEEAAGELAEGAAGESCSLLF
jgi:hypothetical protein